MYDTTNDEVIEKTKVKKKLWKKIVKGLLIFVVIIFVLGAATLGYASIKYGDEIKVAINDANEIVETINKTVFNTRKPTQFYDANGKLLKEFKSNTYYYTKEADLNPYIVEAVTSIEDERFYEHDGIDYKGIARSVWVYIKSQGGTLQGGSTITQQLARNVFLTLDVTMWRKLEEAVIAQKLEERYSKSEILEFYVNNVNYGNGCYSIESASQYYFQKNNKELDISQIALLAAIPNNPSIFDPIRKMDNALKRRNVVLDKMLSLGKISQDEFTSANAKVIKLNVKPYVQSEPMNYDVQYAVHNATLKLMEQDGFVPKYYFDNDKASNAYFNEYEEKYKVKEKQLLAGRYRIDTSIDSAKQQNLQRVVDNHLEKYTDTDNVTGLYQKQGASVTIDNSTGEVVAIVGGRSQKGNTFNRAFLGVRQPGSAIKPLLAYTPAFEKGYIPASEYVDEEINNGPANSHRDYKGSVSLKYAVETSINTIPVRLVDEMGVKSSLKYLQNMQFKYITPEDKSSRVAIGGFTKGVTAVEMASGFSTLSRNGTFISPTNVRKITNTVINEVLFENKHEQIKVYDSGASYLMSDTLKGVISKDYGTGSGLSLNNYPFTAGKTGTTDDSKDCWFVGYTPYYTTSVWVGNDIPVEQDMTGKSGPGFIWKEYMEYLHQNLTQKDFISPDTVINKNGVLMNTIYTKLHPNGSNLMTENSVKSKEVTKDDTSAEDELKVAKEKEYEKSASDAIGVLESFNYADESQTAKVDKLIETANSSLARVKDKDIYSQLKARLQTIKSKFSKKKSNQENKPKTEPEEVQKPVQETVKEPVQEPVKEPVEVPAEKPVENPKKTE